MATQRIYVCPEHPAKDYTSWRKFRGHWSTQHKGEECPPRDDFLQQKEKEEILEDKNERKESMSEAAEIKRQVEVGDDPASFELSDEPIPRLTRILSVHGVESHVADQILGVFQLHPGYRDNPVNLHYLLTAKLPRKLHQSIPMMISAFTTQESSYPQGGMMGMIPGAGGQQSMPPYMMGGGYPPIYPPTFGYPPNYRPPIGGREPPEERESRGRVKETSSIEDAVALISTLMSLKDQLSGGNSEGTPQVKEIFEGFRETIEEMNKESKNQVDSLLQTIEKIEEEHKGAIKGIETNLHDAEKNRLLDRITSLEQIKDDEKTEGLGTLLREAGEGLGAQMEGVRSSITEGAGKVGEIVEKAMTAGASGALPTSPGAPTNKPVKSVADASQIMQAENELEVIAQELEQEA